MTNPPRCVVIGSGPSGATAALALLERGVAVTMLESGSTFRAGAVFRALGRNLYRKWAPAEEPYEFSISGDPATEWRSALTPGGLSNYWTGAVPRFTTEDFFEGERRHPRFRWPVSYAELDPYYTYAEQLLDVVGERRKVPQAVPAQALVHERRLANAWQRVADSAEVQGHGLWYAPFADGPSFTFRRAGHAFNSFTQIMPRLKHFRNFELRLGAHVQRLSYGDDLGCVDGVEYIDRDAKVTRRIAADAVIVAAGPLASPKLLMHSTSAAFPEGLGNRHGVLGRFLHDHPKDWCILRTDRALPRLDQPLHFTRAPYTRSEPLQAATITIGPTAKWDRVLSLVGATTRQFGLVTFATMIPEERNRLSLHPVRRDQFGMPVLDIDIRYGVEVAATISQAHDHLLSALARAGVHGTIECPQDLLAPGASAHYGGGARMHASPEYGVVDAWNRIHGVSNVAVVDASSFTTAVEKNPTLTAMALAARAAHRLADDLTHPTEGAQVPYAIPALR